METAESFPPGQSETLQRGRDAVIFSLSVSLVKSYDSFNKGYVTLDDLAECLWEEAGIKLEKK